MFSKERPRIESIQVIRAIAFILIFLSHVEIIATGPIGVSLFLVLSGFCMTYAYLDRPDKMSTPKLGNNLRFAWSKIKKLYPLHITTLVFVGAIIFGGLILRKGSLQEIGEQGAYFIANALLLQSWIPWRDGYFSFNAVSWYLSTSAFAYFIFPYVFKTFQSNDRRGITKQTVGVLLLMCFVSFILGIGRDLWSISDAIIKYIVYICPLYRAGDFIIGLALGYVFMNIKKKEIGGVLYTLLEISAIALTVIQVIIYNAGVICCTNWTLTLFWLPTSAICILLFALNAGIVSRTLTKCRSIIWIGDISGEAFLIHQICIKVAEYFSEDEWVDAIIAFSLTLICVIIWKRLNKRFSLK